MTRRAVRETYDRIGPHFARTRPEPWPEVESFLRWREGSVGIDVGVGNGRHAELLADACSLVVGLDLSRVVLGEAAERAVGRGFDLSLVLADAVTLPIRDDCVDLAVFVATLHHIPSEALRVRSLSELARVLGPSGRAIVSVWSVTHDRFNGDAGFDAAVDWTLPDGTVVERFYHVYDGDEFLREIGASELAGVSTFESRGNWYAIVTPEQ